MMLLTRLIELALCKGEPSSLEEREELRGMEYELKSSGGMIACKDTGYSFPSWMDKDAMFALDEKGLR